MVSGRVFEDNFGFCIAFFHQVDPLQSFASYCLKRFSDRCLSLHKLECVNDVLRTNWKRHLRYIRLASSFVRRPVFQTYFYICRKRTFYRLFIDRFFYLVRCKQLDITPTFCIFPGYNKNRSAVFGYKRDFPLFILLKLFIENNLFSHIKC